MVGERGRLRAVVGVGWMLVAGACSGGADSSASAVPAQSASGSTTVLDQRASDPPSAEAPSSAAAPPSAEMPPSAEAPLLAAPPPVETLSPAPAESFLPAGPLQPLEPATLDAGMAGTAGEHDLRPIDSAAPVSEPADAGAPLANDASSPGPVPEPPSVAPPPPAESEPAAAPPTNMGAPPQAVSEPPEPPAPPLPAPPLPAPPSPEPPAPPLPAPPSPEPPLPEPAALPPLEPPPEPAAPPPPTSFQSEVWPIFKARCASCHGTRRAGGHSVGSSVLSIAYADAQRLGSTLIERLDGGGMPTSCTGQPGDPGCLTVAELAAVQRWLDTGMAP